MAKDKTEITGYDWSQEKTTGFEGVRTEDLGFPFLSILQPQSPEVNKTAPEYASKKIEGATPGDIIHTIKRIILHKEGSGKPLQVIPTAYQRLYVEWKDRTSGGGLVKVHTSPSILDECTKNPQTGRDTLKNGNIIVTTGYFSGLVEIGGSWERVIIGMSSTQLSKARAWLNMMMSLKVNGPGGAQITPPMFSHIYNVTTVAEKNDKGGWYGWKIESGRMLSDKALIDKARESSQQSVTPERLLNEAPDVM